MTSTFIFVMSMGPKLMLVVQMTGEDRGQPWPSRTRVERWRRPAAGSSPALEAVPGNTMTFQWVPFGSGNSKRCEELAAKPGTCDCEPWELGVKTSSQGSSECGVTETQTRPLCSIRLHLFICW